MKSFLSLKKKVAQNYKTMVQIYFKTFIKILFITNFLAFFFYFSIFSLRNPDPGEKVHADPEITAPLQASPGG